MGFFETVVHQTLTNNENADEVENHGPYKAINIAKTYLGDGYYFWDDHIELAHWWGEVHCKGRYFICEADLKVDDTLFFDLVGNRKNQQTFLKLSTRLNVNHLTIGQAIEFFKEINRAENGIFPYQAIRAVDTSRGSTFQEIIKVFAPNRNGQTSLTPRLIICIIDKSKVSLRNYRVIHPDEFI